jgi:glycosyltransferase involved in cell wall biosynthesis
MTAARVSIGVNVHAQPERLRATLASLRQHTPTDASVILLPDGPDPDTQALLHDLDLPQLGTTEARGAPACFNRLAAATDAPVVVLLESGSLVAPGWLDHLLGGLEASAHHGLAGPSTNRSWNEQAAFRGSADSPEAVARTAARAAQMFAGMVHTLAPLHSLADFCYLVRREVIAAVGEADEGYGLGPCWEMDYNIRAARAGFAGVWVGAAYVHRQTLTPRRRHEETRLSEASRRRYQDKFCGYHLRGERDFYERHCQGDACAEFAPPALISIGLPPPAPAAPAPRPVPPPQGVPGGRPPQPSARPALPRPVGAPAPPAGVTATAGAAVEAGSAARPLVTCIMPTYDRASFVPQAIRYFLRQDLTDSELLILDDGKTPVVALVPEHPRLRYVRLETRLNVGAKRNQACRLARGEFIAHWDDDDWYGPGRLRKQLEALRAGDADVCGSTAELYYEPATDRAWCYRYGGLPHRFMSGASLFYRRAAWERAPFAEVQIGEDARFVAAAGARGARTLIDLADPELAVGIVHPGNTSPKRTRSPYYHPVASGTIHALLGEDLPFYRAAEPAPGTPLLLSCIMPTRNRREFVRRSLLCFEAQDYPHRELIVVDDGDEPIEDLVVEASAVLADTPARIRYLRLPQPTSIGAKRNAACTAAHGSIIVHWDDDDWYGPERLSLQAEPILAGKADLTGLENRYMLELPEARFWSMRPELHRRMFVGDVHGGTLAFRRTLFDRGMRYPPANLAEDAAFIKQALRAGMNLVRVSNPGVFVYIRHGRNAWRFRSGQYLDRTGWVLTEPPQNFPGEALAAYQEIACSHQKEGTR